jgi:hypothetical protein
VRRLTDRTSAAAAKDMWKKKETGRVFGSSEEEEGRNNTPVMAEAQLFTLKQD